LAARFLISGYYGFGNLGDEALLAVIVEQLRGRYPGASIDVLSNTPAETARTYGVEATPRAAPGAVRRAIDRADVVLSGGGGLLQNVTSLRSLLYYAGIVRTADPVFLFKPGEQALDLAAEGLADDGAPLVVVSVRRWHGADATAAALAVAIDRLRERAGARVALLPLGGPPDADAATVVIRKCRSTPVLLPDYPLPQAAQVIGRASLVIGMRLHALIIAARLGVPFTALPYDPKVSALCEELSYPLEPLFVPGVKPPPDAEIVARIDAAWDRRAELAAHLRAIAADTERLALRNFDVLDELVNETSA